MIALSILAVGLLAMLAVQISALRQGRMGRHVTQAAQVARDAMELLQRVDWTDPRLAPTAWTALQPVTTVVQSAGGPAQEQVFNVQWRITNDVADANLRLLDVRVLWNESGQGAAAPPRRYAMSSIRHNDP